MQQSFQKSGQAEEGDFAGSVIFIVGNSRSGTTLMARILNRHPDVCILNETHFMEEFSFQRRINDFDKGTLGNIINRMLTIQEKGYYRKNEVTAYPETEPVEARLLAQNNLKFRDIIRFMFAHEAHKQGKRIPGDQTPRHVFYLQEIKKIFPEALFINMLRDPRGVLLSQKYKWKAGIRKSPPLYEVIRAHFNYHPMLMSFLWRKGIEAALHTPADIKNDAMQNVKFEDLTNHPEDTIKSVCAFLGIEYSETMLDVTVSMSSRGMDEGTKWI